MLVTALATGGSAAHAQTPGTPATPAPLGATAANPDKKPSWDVNKPPGAARVVNLDTRTGSWMGFIERNHAFVTPLPTTGKPLTVGTKMEGLPVRQLDLSASTALQFSGDSRQVRFALGDELFTTPLTAAFPPAVVAAEGLQGADAKKTRRQRLQGT